MQNVTSPHLLLLNTGAWSLVREPYYHFTHISKIINILENIKLKTTGHNLRIVWFTTSPRGESQQNQNCYITAAANTYFVAKFAEIGVEVFDPFRIIYPMTEYHVCNYHYSCVGWNNSKVYMSGKVGFATMNVFLRNLCEDVVKM